MDDAVHIGGAGEGERAIERADLSATPEGRAVAAAFVSSFGELMTDTVRPVLREVAAAGGEPQLLVNGLAQLLREVATSIEFPIGQARAPEAEPDTEG